MTESLSVAFETDVTAAERTKICGHHDIRVQLGRFATQLVRAVVAAHSAYPGMHRVLLDEAPSSEEYRNPHREFEIEYLAYYAEAVATYQKRQPNSVDRVVARVMSDAFDGVIHNAARRGAIDEPMMQRELVRLITLYLKELGQIGES